MEHKPTITRLPRLLLIGIALITLATAELFVWKTICEDNQSQPVQSESPTFAVRI